MVTSQGGGAFLKGQDLLLQSGELQDSQRVVFREETAQCVPAAADTHHHVFTMKHLWTKKKSFGKNILSLRPTHLVWCIKKRSDIVLVLQK